MRRLPPLVGGDGEVGNERRVCLVPRQQARRDTGRLARRRRDGPRGSRVRPPTSSWPHRHGGLLSPGSTGTRADLQWAAPEAIVASITPFGLVGPMRDLRATPFVSFAMGGGMHWTGHR